MTGKVLAVSAAVTALAFVIAPNAGDRSASDKVITIREELESLQTLREERDDYSQVPPPAPSPAVAPSPSVSPGAAPAASPSAGTPRRPTAERVARRSSAPSSARPGVVLDGRTMGGWYGGASGIGVRDGSFEQWLGQPVTLAAMWSDTSDEVQRTLPSLVAYRDWKGGIDLAVGGTVLGTSENYAAAARGEYDDRWRAAAKVLADVRKGAKGPTFVRPWHEMNGDWYDEWMVTRENSADFKKAFARYAGILRAALPEVYIVWSPNFGDHTGLPVDYWYPGDHVVDVVAPDYYDDGHSDASHSIAAWNDEADDRDKNGNPKGPESWRQFAASRDKPVGFPEWGLKPEGQGVDHPEWIKAVNAWMNRHANTATWQIGQDIPRAAAGKVLYSAYFNVEHGGNAGFTIYGAGANPKSAAVFPGLKWGNQRR